MLIFLKILLCNFFYFKYTVTIVNMKEKKKQKKTEELLLDAKSIRKNLGFSWFRSLFLESKNIIRVCFSKHM